VPSSFADPRAWTKAGGDWKINYIITNKEMPPKMLREEECASADAAAAGKAAT
jgi:hypothetical protein